MKKKTIVVSILVVLAIISFIGNQLSKKEEDKQGVGVEIASENTSNSQSAEGEEATDSLDSDFDDEEETPSSEAPIVQLVNNTHMDNFLDYLKDDINITTEYELGSNFKQTETICKHGDDISNKIEVDGKYSKSITIYNGIYYIELIDQTNGTYELYEYTPDVENINEDVISYIDYMKNITRISIALLNENSIIDEDNTQFIDSSNYLWFRFKDNNGVLDEYIECKATLDGKTNKLGTAEYTDSSEHFKMSFEYTNDFELTDRYNIAEPITFEQLSDVMLKYILLSD